MNAKLRPAELGVAVPSPVATLPVTRLRGDLRVEADDRLAEETPVAVLCNGEAFAVMLATPADLDDFAHGFALTEGLVEHSRELVLVEQRVLEDGIELDLTLALGRPRIAQERERWLAGRSGCGLCGKRMLEEAVRVPPALPEGAPVGRDAIARAVAALADAQPWNRATGAVHAAAWADRAGALVAVREDIGRHNALDKLIGARLRGNFPPGFAVVTSRASYEMAQKAAIAGIDLLAAVSAPTARAVRLADACNVTLAGFARGDNLVVYSHAGRVR